MSSYDQPQEMITMDEFRESMRFVRLQIAVPISVLMSLGTTIICSMIIKPGLGAIMDLHPTLLTPSKKILGVYVAVFFILQGGMCLLLIVARGRETKETLVRGVGVRIAAANWLMAAGVVCWTLQWFTPAAVLVLVAFLLVLSMHFTLHRFTPTFAKPLTAIFVHTTVSLLLALLLSMTLYVGSVALGWVINKSSKWDKWVWPAVGALLGTHGLSALWEAFSMQYILAFGNEVLAAAVLLAAPRTDPRLPDSSRPKPGALVFSLIGILALHPLALAAGMLLARRRRSEGRIRLEEEAELADERAREAEEEARRARQAAEAVDA